MNKDAFSIKKLIEKLDKVEYNNPSDEAIKELDSIDIVLQKDDDWNRTKKEIMNKAEASDFFDLFVKDQKLANALINKGNELIKTLGETTEDLKKDYSDYSIDVEQIALDNNIDLAQLKKGIEIEKEHSDVVNNDISKVIQIAVDHLKEVSDYYDKLETYVEPKTDAEDKYLNVENEQIDPVVVSDLNYYKDTDDVKIDKISMVKKIKDSSGVDDTKAWKLVQDMVDRYYATGDDADIIFKEEITEKVVNWSINKEIIFNIDDTEYYADTDISLFNDTKYGSDLDNQRGIEKISIEDININKVQDENGNIVEITDEIKDIVNHKVENMDISELTQEEQVEETNERTVATLEDFDIIDLNILENTDFSNIYTLLDGKLTILEDTNIKINNLKLLPSYDSNEVFLAKSIDGNKTKITVGSAEKIMSDFGISNEYIELARKSIGEWISIDSSVCEKIANKGDVVKATGKEGFYKFVAYKDDKAILKTQSGENIILPAIDVRVVENTISEYSLDETPILNLDIMKQIKNKTDEYDADINLNDIQNIIKAIASLRLEDSVMKLIKLYSNDNLQEQHYNGYGKLPKKEEIDAVKLHNSKKEDIQLKPEQIVGAIDAVRNRLNISKEFASQMVRSFINKTATNGESVIVINDYLKANESVIQEEDKDNFKTIAKGISDEEVANDIAKNKGGIVIKDIDNKDKYMVILKEKYTNSDIQTIIAEYISKTTILAEDLNKKEQLLEENLKLRSEKIMEELVAKSNKDLEFIREAWQKLEDKKKEVFESMKNAANLKKLSIVEKQNVLLDKLLNNNEE